MNALEPKKMTTLATKALGEVEIAATDVITFADGLLGFGDRRDFVLLAESGESVFKWLQSTEEPGLAFVVIEPELFLRQVYRPQPAAGELESLGVDGVEQCSVYLIVTIPQNNPRGMTANLQGPVLIHKGSRRGRQVISNHPEHLVRVSIMEQLEG